jgi:hypothetical protein
MQFYGVELTRILQRRSLRLCIRHWPLSPFSAETRLLSKIPLHRERFYIISPYIYTTPRNGLHEAYKPLHHLELFSFLSFLFSPPTSPPETGIK